MFVKCIRFLDHLHHMMALLWIGAGITVLQVYMYVKYMICFIVLTRLLIISIELQKSCAKSTKLMSSVIQKVYQGK